MKVELLKPGTDINLNPDSDIQYVLIPEGESKVTIAPKSQGIKTELIVLYNLSNDQEVFLTTTSLHEIPNTTCMVSVKAVLRDKSKSNYIGKIVIEKKAQQTASYLEDNVLALGKGVKNESQPILEIEADEVKASHGATTGRIDESQIYYLTSRGISRQQAEKVIVEGFFETLIGSIADEKIREEVRKKIYA